MGVEENKEVVPKVEESWDSGDAGSLDQYFASDFDKSQTIMQQLGAMPAPAP